uniref:Uncharacterized protein n=1 Tax=Anguilla anguilla TaxID=7936 RepID=A0A0E9X8H2_ANGAN
MMQLLLLMSGVRAGQVCFLFLFFFSCACNSNLYCTKEQKRNKHKAFQFCIPQGSCKFNIEFLLFRYHFPGLRFNCFILHRSCNLFKVEFFQICLSLLLLLIFFDNFVSWRCLYISFYA